MRSFLTLALALAATVAGCGGGSGKAGAGDPAKQAEAPAPAPAVPESCDEPAAAAKEARAGGEASDTDRIAAVFALAECEQLRLGVMELDEDARAAYEAKLREIVALYTEAVEGPVPKYVIGGHVRTGDLYLRAMGAATKLGAAGSAPEYKAKARASYESGLGAADSTDRETRLDLDISDWVKAGCKGLVQVGVKERKFKVCHPWKDSWR
jgi:hypothetical protein